MCFDPVINYIFLCSLVKETAFAVIAPILSLQFLKEELSASNQGLIFATYSAAIILWSPIVGGVLLKRYNGRTVIIAGMFLYSIVFYLYGFIEGMSGNHTLIVVYTTILRALQGIASATIQTTQYDIGSKTKSGTFIVGGIECITGIGLALGPEMGAITFQLLSFQWCFMIVGSILLSASILFLFFFPAVEDPQTT